MIKLYTLNVGHGLCQVILFPKGRAIVIDGGSFKTRREVERFLKTHVKVILAYIATHNHLDHVGASLHLLSNERFSSKHTLRQIWALVDRGSEWPVPLVKYARRREREGSIERFFYATLTDELVFAPRKVAEDPGVGAQVTLLHPRVIDNMDAVARPKSSSPASNRTSVILRVNVGDVAALISGDADTESFRRVKQDYRFSLRATVVTIPHHGGSVPGANRSWTWNHVASEIRPSYAIVSSGESSVVQAAALNPFVNVGAQLACTQITTACHPQVTSLRPGVLSSVAPHFWIEGPDVTGTPCCGCVCIELTAERATMKRGQHHRRAVQLRVRPSGTPICLGGSGS